MLSEKQLET
jgi:hypothetical protein